MNCIIRVGVCHVQVSYYIATMFVVVLHLHCFRFVSMSVPCLILLDFNVSYQMRDVYSDYISLLLFHPKYIAGYVSPFIRTVKHFCEFRKMHVKQTCTVILVSGRFNFSLLTCVFTVYTQLGKFVFFVWNLSSCEFVNNLSFENVFKYNLLLYLTTACNIY